MATRDLIAANLKTLRDLRGLSQIDLAKRVGVSRRTVARLEAGEIADPGVDQVSAIARALGVTPALMTADRLTVVALPLPERVHELLESERGPDLLEELCRGLLRGPVRAG